MSGSKTISTSETRLEAMSFQSSAYGVVLQVAYGVCRIAGNLMWYGGFKAIPHTSTQSAGGKGGDVKTKNTTYTYQSALILGLCDGEVTGVSAIWRGKNRYTGGATGSQVLTATESFTIPMGGGTFTVAHATDYSVPIYVRMPTGGGRNRDQPFYAPEGSGYTRVGGEYVFDETFEGSTASIRYQYLDSGATQSSLGQLGLSLARGVLGQATWPWLASNYPSEALGYSGISYVYSSAYDLGDSARVENHNFEVQAQMAYHLGSSVPDVDAALVGVDIITNSRYGVPDFPAEMIDVTEWSTYCRAAGLLLSPVFSEQAPAAQRLLDLCKLTNSGPVWSEGVLKIVPYGDETLTANGTTYTPNTTPVYDLTDAHFLNLDQPVKRTRKSPANAYNHVRLEFKDRANQYNTAIAEAKDQAAIDSFGLRSSEVIRAHWICDAGVARTVAQLMLQRLLYVRNTYEFDLPANFTRLEPMDIVTITDEHLNLDTYAVRITQREDNPDYSIRFIAEDFPEGIAGATLYPNEAGIGFSHNYNAAPGDVNDPVIFEAPYVMSSSGLEVWVGVNGSGANWGGCKVWLSLDGTNYRLLGTVSGGHRIGTVMGAISGGNLNVQLNGPGELISGSASDAAALSTLCYIDGGGTVADEFLAYTTATLTGPGQYQLSGLVRGAYSTNGLDPHALGDRFVRVDDSIAKSGPLDLTMIGKTIYFKFTSFNIFGGGEQTLADVGDYPYTIGGVALTRVSTGLGIRINATDFSGSANYNEAYIHGIDANGTAVDRPGAISVNGKLTAVANGVVYSSLLFPKGWIVWDSTGSARFATISGNTHFAIVKRENGKWYWDANSGTMGELTLLDTDYVIGTIEINDLDDNNPPGIARATMMAAAMSPAVLVALGDTAVWNQVNGRPKSWRVGAGGLSVVGPTTLPAVGFMDGETNASIGTMTRSWALMAIKRSDNSIVFGPQYYDVYTEGTDTGNPLGYGRGSAALAADLNALSSDVWAVVTTYDEPAQNRNANGLPAALKRCGARQATLDQIQSRGAYVLIGVPGVGEGGAVYEGRRGDVPNATNAWIDVSFQTYNGQIIGVSAADGAVNSALALAATAQATADGKIDSFYQTSPPSVAGEGDFWIDTDDSNKLYIRTGGIWVLSADTRIAGAITAAAGAQATADGKVTTFYAGSAPTATAVGDLWFNTSTGRSYRWNGSSWVLVTTVGAGDIDSTKIAANGATIPLSFTSDSGTYSCSYYIGYPTGAIVSYEYQNTTPESVVVEAFASGGFRVASSSSNSMSYIVQLTVEFYDTSHVNIPALGRTIGHAQVYSPNPIDFSKASPAYTVAPGEYVKFTLRIFGNGTGNPADYLNVNWDQVALRMNVIKK